MPSYIRRDKLQIIGTGDGVAEWIETSVATHIGAGSKPAAGGIFLLPGHDRYQPTKKSAKPKQTANGHSCRAS